MCKVLKVSRSSYYKHLHKKPSNRAIENATIGKKIIDVHKESKNRYGAVKINEALRSSGITISLKKTQRLIEYFTHRRTPIHFWKPIVHTNKTALNSM
jgi:hypothetical protein